MRNHRKLVIADGARAWSGGRNVGDEYFAADSVWIDLSFTIAGPAVNDLAHLYAADWAFATKTPIQIETTIPARVGAQIVQIVPSGPTLARDTLQELLLTACYGAQRRILIATPYFIPDEALQQALMLAARRGVSVSLFLPQRSNHRLADIARTRYLRDLIAAGATIRVLPDAMLHAKAVLADDLALAGSANVDLRSLFLNFEVNYLFPSPTDSLTLANWFTKLELLTVNYLPTSARLGLGLIEGLVLLVAFQI